MHIAEVVASHPLLAGAGYTEGRLRWLPASWVPVLHDALTQLEELLTSDQIARLTVEVGEKYSTLRIDANLDASTPGFTLLQERIEQICVEAEDRSGGLG